MNKENYEEHIINEWLPDTIRGVSNMYEDYKDLDYMNGWGSDTPKEYTECKCKDHVITEIRLNRQNTNNMYVCDLCKIKWFVDSSD